jgi:hypothetical protein
MKAPAAIDEAIRLVRFVYGQHGNSCLKVTYRFTSALVRLTC